MDTLTTIIVFTIISKMIAARKKILYNENQEVSVYLFIIIIKIFTLLLLCSYVFYTDTKSISNFQNKNMEKSIYILFLISCFITLNTIFIAPIFKKMDYSKYKLLRSPISIIITILVSKHYLNEDITINMYISFLFLGIALYFYYKK